MSLFKLSFGLVFAVLLLPSLSAWGAPIVTLGTVNNLTSTADIKVAGDVNDTGFLAVNVNSNANQTVRGLLFQADGIGNVGAPISGSGRTIQITANNNIFPLWGTAPTLGGTDSAALNTILSSIRWQGSGNLQTTLSGLTVGQQYRVQMLTHANDNQPTRQWDIYFDALGANTLAVDDFNPGTLGNGKTWEYVFAATNPTMVIDFRQGTGGAGTTDANPILQGVILSQILVVPEPGSLAIWLLSMLAIFGLGYFRMRRK